MNSATWKSGFAEADFVREDITFYEGSTHLALEQHASVAQFSHDGKLTLWTCTQDPHYLHRSLAKVLELPPSHIRVIATPNGGGFGGKCDPFTHEIIVSQAGDDDGAPRQDLPDARGGLLLPSRPASRPDVAPRPDSRRTAPSRPCTIARFLDGGAYGGHGVASTFYTGVLQTDDVRDASATSSKPFACSPTRRPAVRNADMARRSRASPRKSRWTRSPSSWRLDPAEMRKQHLRPAQFADGELASRRHAWAWASASTRSWKAPAGRTVPQAALRKRHRDRLQRLHDRGADSNLLEQDAALRRAVETGPQRRS